MKKSTKTCLFLFTVVVVFALVAPVRSAFAGSCLTSPSSANCDAKDPNATGCYADAVDLTSTTSAGLTVRLRYSPKCQSAWSRVDTTPTPVIPLLTACVKRKPLTSSSPQCYSEVSTNVYTDMLFLGRSTYQGQATGLSQGGSTVPTVWKYGY